MPVVARELVRQAEHRIGGEIDEMATIDVVNQAGRWFLSSWPWRFLGRPPYRLDLRASATVTAGTWDESSKTLTVTAPAAAFSSYTFLAGDQFEVTAGTNANLAFYEVVSSSSSSLTFRTSIGSGANGSANIAGVLSASACALPSDFQELAGTPCGSVSGRAVYPMTPSGLTGAKAREDSAASGNYFASIVYAQAASVTRGGAPVPRLELHPTPSTNERSAVMVFYRAGWIDLVEDDDLSNTPDWFDPLLIQAVRGYAFGLDQDTMEIETAKVRGSVMFEDAKRRDSSVQKRSGKFRGGANQAQLSAGDAHITTLDFVYP